MYRAVMNMNLSDLILAGDRLPTINIANINLGIVGEDSEEGIIGMPGLIALYEGKGLTNESMSSNPVWKDLSGNGYDLEMRNFAWKLDSGCGKYEHDFSTWTYSDTATVIKKSPNHVIYQGNTDCYMFSLDLKAINNFKIKINDITKGVALNVAYFDISMWRIAQTFEGVGIHEIDSSLFPETASKVKFSLSKDGQVDLEQIPDYAGAIVFDGVNDFGVCKNTPLLTPDKGYTVMALRYILKISSNSALCGKCDTNDGAFIFEHYGLSGFTAFSFFGTTGNLKKNDPITYQTSNEYNGQSIKVGPRPDVNVLVVGCSSFYQDGPYNPGCSAIYSLVIFDHDTTEEERQRVINYWKREYPELFLDKA